MATFHIPFKLRPVALLAFMGLIGVQILLFSPTPLEQTPLERGEKVLAAPDLARLSGAKRPAPLAPGIPKDQVPDYFINHFEYLSSFKGAREWKIVAKAAYVYKKDDLVHCEDVTAHLYNTDGTITQVVGKEAKYYLNSRDIEIFGDVVTTLPDGFKLESEYLRNRASKQVIDVPLEYKVIGTGVPENGRTISFTSLGLIFPMQENVVTLPKNVRFVLDQVEENKNESTPTSTVIESDRADIVKNNQIAYFTMDSGRALKERFVYVRQPDMTIRSREVDLNYGDFSELVHYMVARKDVYFKEEGTGSEVRYGTCGRADFDAHKNVVVLTQFPQVYQDNDTVTGEVITLHRDTDLVEVKHSNAFSEGQKTNTPGN